jgi:cold shock protein
MMVIATVKSWSDEEGWGVLVSPDCPGDIWAHHTMIDSPGFRTVAEGEEVSLEFEDLGSPLQDGYRYRATRIVRALDE